MCQMNSLFFQSKLLNSSLNYYISKELKTRTQHVEKSIHMVFFYNRKKVHMVHDC